MDRRAFVLASASLLIAPRALARTGTEVALVTADLEARLVAVELATGRVLRYVPTVPKPRSIEAVGHMAVVAHSELGAVSLVHAPLTALLVAVAVGCQVTAGVLVRRIARLEGV